MYSKYKSKMFSSETWNAIHKILDDLSITKPIDKLSDDILLKIMVDLDDKSLCNFVNSANKYNELFRNNKAYIIKEKFSKYGILVGHQQIVSSVAWSPDGTQVASGSFDEIIRIWDANSGTLLKILRGHANKVTTLAWSPDGTKIVSGTYDGTIQIWDVINGSLIKTFANLLHWIRTVAWSPDGSKIVVGAMSYLNIFNANNGNVLYNIHYTGQVTSASWSPDGRKIVLGTSWENMVRVIDSTNGTIVRVLIGHENKHRKVVLSVAWSPDGTKIATGGEDKTVRIWDSSDGSLIKILRGHSSHVNSLAWSPDSSKIVSGGKDGTIRIWGARNGMMLKDFPGGVVYSVNTVAWSPDETKIASGSDDYSVRIWNVNKLSGGKNMKKIYNGKSFKVHTGTRGGRYILVGKDKKKLYIHL